MKLKIEFTIDDDIDRPIDEIYKGLRSILKFGAIHNDIHEIYLHDTKRKTIGLITISKGCGS